MNPAFQIDTPMTRAEVRASLSLAAIYMLRMLGMFLVLPVLSVFAREIPDATPQLVGFAISAYGLTQAIFQIPFGLWSDRYGRKRLIVLGLLLFAAGSALAALSDSIYGIIAGRALQGAGAVAGVVMALVADLTREEHRTKAMALIGVSIGISFALSMVIGPVLSGWLGLHGLFWIITALALLSIILLYTVVPTPAVSRFHRDAEVRPASLKEVLANRELLRMDLGIFCLHLVLTATFVVLPLILRDTLQLETAKHWHIYLPVFALALASMAPFVVLAEKRHKMKAVFVSFIGLVAISNAGFAWLQHDFWSVFGLLYLFFTGFNLLESMLPSLISKVAPLELKGTAMGVYSTAQFLGAFVGGAGGGWIYGHYGIPYVFLFCAAVALLWFMIALGMKAPRGLSSLMVNVRRLSQDQASSLSRRLLQIPGVAEAVVLAEDGVAYLKIDKEKLDRMALNGLLQELAA